MITQVRQFAQTAQFLGTPYKLVFTRTSLYSPVQACIHPYKLVFTRTSLHSPVQACIQPYKLVVASIAPLCGGKQSVLRLRDGHCINHEGTDTERIARNLLFIMSLSLSLSLRLPPTDFSVKNTKKCQGGGCSPVGGTEFLLLLQPSVVRVIFKFSYIIAAAVSVACGIFTYYFYIHCVQ
jgi:hypothetical protein